MITAGVVVLTAATPTHYWLRLTGCSAQTKDQPWRCAAVTTRAAVRCCVDDPCFDSPACTSICSSERMHKNTMSSAPLTVAAQAGAGAKGSLSVTVGEAAAECAAHGRRLCAPNELEDRRCCRTGCGIDRLPVWSNASCDQGSVKAWSACEGNSSCGSTAQHRPTPVRRTPRNYEYPCRPGLLDSRSKYASTFEELPAYTPARAIAPLSATPRVIIQAVKVRRMPQRMAWHLRRWQEFNPTWAQRLFVNAEMSVFVRSAADSANATALVADAARAYRSLRSWELRSDLFRLLYLYLRGGLWMDGDCYVAGELPISAEDELVVPLDGGGARGGEVLQAVFGGAPGHPMLEAALRRVVSNVLTRTPERDDMNVGKEAAYTGPVVLAHAFHSAIGTTHWTKGRNRLRGGRWTYTVFESIQAYGSKGRGFMGGAVFHKWAFSDQDKSALGQTGWKGLAVFVD